MSVPKNGITADRKTPDKLQFIVDNFNILHKKEIAFQIGESPRWVKRQISFLKKEGRIQNKRKITDNPLSEGDWTREIKERAISLRVDELRTSEEISETLKKEFNFDVPSYTVEHWLINKFNCRMPSKEEWLKRFLPYNRAENLLQQGSTMKDISEDLYDEYGVYISDDLIYTYLNSIGLSSLRIYNINKIRDKSKEFSRDWLKENIEAHAGLNGLIEKMGCSKTIVMKRIKEEGLSLIKHRISWSYNLDDIRDRLLEVGILERQIPKNDEHQMILGWILGDGSLNNTGRFIVHHTLSQLSYLYVKCRVLHKYVASVFTVPAKIVIKGDIYAESNDQIGFSCIGLNHYVRYLNSDGSKNYNMILSELNDLGWACYFMDDGSLSNKKQIISMSYEMATNLEFKYRFLKKVRASVLEVKDINSKYLLPSFSYKTTSILAGDYWKEYIGEVFDIKKIDSILDLSLLSIRSGDRVINEATRYYQEKHGFPYFNVNAEYLNREWGSLVSLKTESIWKDSNILRQIHIGDSIYKTLMPHIAEAKSKGMSPLDLFNSFSLLRDVINRTLKSKKSVLPSFLYDSLFFHARGVSGFPCGIAKALVGKFSKEGDIVVDPCAGWGGRLLGTVSSNRKYVGFEPWDKTVLGLNKIAKFVGRENDVSVFHSEFDRLKAPKSCDLILTSPPYMDFEVYGKSVDKVSWLTLMKDIFEYAEEALKVNGCLLLNLPKYLKEILPKTSLFEQPVVYWFSSSRKRDTTKAEVIYVWKK